MERVSQAQLNSALTTTDAQLQKRLSTSDGSALTILLESLAKRYPTQDQTETIQEYMKDYAALVLRYSLRQVEEAVAALRVDPRQEFFPKPNEVAAEIERQRLRHVPSHIYARG